MQTIVTKSTRERMIRNGLVMVMLLGFSAYSFYDGYIGYPQDNLVNMRGEIPADVQEQAQINPTVVQGSLPPVRKGETLREAEEKLGPPTWKGEALEEFNKAVWFGPGGMLILRYDNFGTITSRMLWKPAKHTETDLMFQKWMGVVVGLIGLWVLVRVLAMVLTSTKLSDEGLTTPRGRLIRYEEMTEWNPADYRDKGRIELGYTQGGRSGVFVLDDYKLRAFRPIVEEICARKGFANPLAESDAGGDTPTEGAQEQTT